jgi:hypothetical protein
LQGGGGSQPSPALAATDRFEVRRLDEHRPHGLLPPIAERGIAHCHCFPVRIVSNDYVVSSVQHAVRAPHEPDAEFIDRPLSATTDAQSKIFIDERFHVDLTSASLRPEARPGGSRAAPVRIGLHPAGGSAGLGVICRFILRIRKCPAGNQKLEELFSTSRSRRG